MLFLFQTIFDRGQIWFIMVLFATIGCHTCVGFIHNIPQSYAFNNNLGNKNTCSLKDQNLSFVISSSWIYCSRCRTSHKCKENGDDIEMKSRELIDKNKKIQHPIKPNKYKYQAPKFSDSFMDHLADVKEGSKNINDDEGVECDGEPSIDPSRTVTDDGFLDSEYLSDY